MTKKNIKTNKKSLEINNNQARKDRTKKNLERNLSEGIKGANELENDAFNLLTGKKAWMIVRVLAIFPVIFGFLALIDFALPNEGDMKQVKSKFAQPAIYTFTIFYTDGTQDKVSEEAYSHIQKGNSLRLEYSPIFNEYYGCRIINESKQEQFVDGEFTIYYFYPTFPIIFILPLYLFFFKERTRAFYLLYFASVTFYPALLLHYMFIEERLAPLSEFLFGWV